MPHAKDPASAGEQLSLDPDSTGLPHTVNPAAPAWPRCGDVKAPSASIASAHAAPDTPTENVQTLAHLIAEGRRPRSRRFAELEPYRDVLLAERRTGASIRLLAQSLAKLGVTISEETLRVWLLRQKMPKRRRPRKTPAAVVNPKVGAEATPRFVPIASPALYPKPELPRRSPRIARDVF